MTSPSNFFSFMHLLLLFSLFNFIVLAHFASFVEALCHDDERSSLLLFKKSLIINKSASYDPSAYPKVASWKADEDCCSWDGVTCNEVTGHLIKLDLTSSCLYGSINSSNTLFQLVHLKWLSLADNNFTGSKIPSEIMNLSKLSYLNLSSSVFSGQIPSEILELSKLETLDASHNHNLELKNPSLKSLVEKLTHLKVLRLSQVNISSSVPNILTNLSSLTELVLRDCELQGEFPAKIFQLPHIHYLCVRYNEDLSGYLPEFEKSSPLQHILLAGTRFSGEIPYSIGNLSSLLLLDISNCSFSGSIPSSLGDLTKITYLYLSKNNFSGELPTVFANLSSLEELGLSYNKFSSQDAGSLSWMANYNKLTYLGLSQINLIGEIPSWLMNLTHLTHLYMSQNILNRSIPSWLMNLNQLVELSLSFNQLTGCIPSQIRNLTQLTTLALGSNQLQGLFPSSLCNLKNLEVLDLGSNNLSGTVDIHMLLDQLRILEFLILSSNNFSLLTKTNIYIQFPKLLIIELRSCNLFDFPNFLEKQDQLEVLDLSSNKISGQIPRWFLNLSLDLLLELNLSNNLLTGFDQHQFFFSWNRLDRLDLSSNKLQGLLPLPPSSTTEYRISNNNLAGQIPSSICNSNELKVLDLSHNNLSGKLPQCLVNFSRQLRLLNLQNNKFQGSIPDNFVNGSKLRMIDLSQNQLQGRIPRSLANCTELEFLALGNNQITDTFPAWLEALPNLKVLILKSNHLSGAIKEPKTEYAFHELRIIDLSHNKFTGNLPSKYFNSWRAMTVVNASSLTYMQEEDSTFIITGHDLIEWIENLPVSYSYSLQITAKGVELEYKKVSNLITAIIFSSNKFEGEIPPSIGRLRGLHFLVLSNNNLRGPIPPSMGNLIALEALDLSNNKLSGRIPQQLEDLTFLSYFNVSNNHLRGPIPEGKQFDTFENNSFEGNTGLCGKQIAKKCEDFQPSKKEEDSASSKFPLEFGWKIVLAGYASGILVGVALEHAFSPRKKVLFMKIFERKLINAFGRRRAH